MPAASSASLRPISWVAIDLTLTTSRAPVACTSRGDDLVGLGRVARPVHDAAARGDLLLELLEQLGQPGQRGRLERPAGLAQLLPVGHLRDHRGPLAADRRGGAADVAAQLGVAERPAGGGGEAAPRPAGARPPPGRGRAGRPRKVVTGHPRGDAAPARHRRVVRRGQDLGEVHVRTPARSRDSPPPMCMRHDASPAVHDLGAGAHARAASCRRASPSTCRRS